jgi:hypothetical protein
MLVEFGIEFFASAGSATSSTRKTDPNGAARSYTGFGFTPMSEHRGKILRSPLALAANHAELQVFLLRLFEVFLGVIFQIFGDSKGLFTIFENLLQAVIVLT